MAKSDKDIIIAKLKSEYPTLRRGNDEDGYELIDDTEYEKIINEWADFEIDKLNEEKTIASKGKAKSDLLNRLGITEEEAKLLLA